MADLKDLKGKWAIVTGASSGIGYCFSLRLAEYGCNLVMISNQPEELRQKAGEIEKLFNVRTLTLDIDLTAPDAVSSIEKEIDAKGLDVEILINNAGIFSFKPVVDTPEGKIECFIDLHVGAVTRLSRWFALRRKEKGSGWLLNMSSMSCWTPMPGIAMYAATKAYIRVFTRALRYEMKDYGVNVMAACPGGIATDLFGLPENLKKLAVNICVLQTPEKFTKKALRQLMKGKQQYINGWLNRSAILFVGITPTSIRMLVKHKLLDRMS